MKSRTEAPNAGLSPTELISKVDALLVLLHSRRLSKLGPDESGLSAHYQDLIDWGVTVPGLGT